MAKPSSPCKSPKTAAELRDAARSALGNDVLLPNFVPVLPTRWPAAGGGVVYWTYHWEPLPTGMVRYKLRGPTNEIKFASLSTPPDVRRLGPGKELGTEDYVDRPEGEESSLLRAEEALVEIIAACREPETARADLQPYIDWLRLHPLVGRDLETRSPAFFAWLKPKGPPA